MAVARGERNQRQRDHALRTKHLNEFRPTGLTLQIRDHERLLAGQNPPGGRPLQRHGQVNLATRRPAFADAMHMHDVGFGVVQHEGKPLKIDNSPQRLSQAVAQALQVAMVGNGLRKFKERLVDLRLRVLHVNQHSNTTPVEPRFRQLPSACAELLGTMSSLAGSTGSPWAPPSASSRVWDGERRHRQLPFRALAPAKESIRLGPMHETGHPRWQRLLLRLPPPAFIRVRCLTARNAAGHSSVVPIVCPPRGGAAVSGSHRASTQDSPGSGGGRIPARSRATEDHGLLSARRSNHLPLSTRGRTSGPLGNGSGTRLANCDVDHAQQATGARRFRPHGRRCAGGAIAPADARIGRPAGLRRAAGLAGPAPFARSSRSLYAATPTFAGRVGLDSPDFGPLTIPLAALGRNRKPLT